MKSTYYGNYNYMTRVEESRSRRIARTRQVRRQKILVVIGFLITIAMCLFFSIKAFANTDTDMKESDNKQFRSIMIYCGDTVDSVAQDHFDERFRSVGRLEDEIRSINHLTATEKLIPGNYLVIPYY